MIYNAGRLNKRITFYGKTQIKTNKGFNTTKESELFTCWAAVQPIRATEMLENEALLNTTTVKFLIRYRKSITSDMTIYYNGNPYRIKSIVNPYESNESLEILAELISRGESTNNKTVGGVSRWPTN